METVVILIIAYFIMYLLTVCRLIVGFTKITSQTVTYSPPAKAFSIIIPFRNEAENLPLLLESIRKIKYPKDMFEIILIDDASEDNSAAVIYSWRMTHGQFETTLLDAVKITGSPKKDAIARAVPIAKHEWIITTDADCTFHENWLLTYNEFILNHHTVEMIAGAVAYRDTKWFLGLFQKIDFLSLQGATIGSFGLGKAFMCNGANFAYTKKLYDELKGFHGNSKIATGDDVFLLQKAISRCPIKVAYLKSKENIVTTKPVESWWALFNQRARWASKTVSYEHSFGELTALVILFGNLSIVVLAALTACGYFPPMLLLITFSAKFIIDLVLLLQSNKFLYNGRFIFPILSSLLYPFFSVAVALYSVIGKYEWKGRKFS